MDCSHLYSISTVRNLVILDASSILRMLDMFMPSITQQQKESLLKVVFTSSERHCAELLKDADVCMDDIYSDQYLDKLTTVCMHRDKLLNLHIGDKMVDDIFCQQAATSFVLKIVQPSIVYLIVEDYQTVFRDQNFVRSLV